MSPEPQESGEFTKPGYDGRLAYYDVVKQIMFNIANVSVTSDYEQWYKSVMALYTILRPYIKDTVASKIKDDLESIKEKVYDGSYYNKDNQAVVSAFIDTRLNEITQDVYVAAKHMLLPIKDEDSTEWKDDDFFKGSDI